ncbi:DUF432 domain-containing protein [Pyrodictium occultum]|nr:DUF432 domain-containing protein [Pyrodictium occultum]
MLFSGMWRMSGTGGGHHEGGPPPAGGEQPRLTLEPGGELSLGRLEAKLGTNGLLEACDGYNCIRARLPRGAAARLEPVPPVHVPSQMTNCLYLEFEEQLVTPGEHAVFWATVPYELAIYANGVLLGYLSPLRVKYTLVGDVVEGTVCRYHRSRASTDPRELQAGMEEALAAIEFRGAPGRVPGVGFHVADIPLYVKDGRVYYPLVRAEVGASRVSSRVDQRPPVEGARGVQRSRQRGILPQVFVVTI